MVIARPPAQGDPVSWGGEDGVQFIWERVNDAITCLEPAAHGGVPPSVPPHAGITRDSGDETGAEKLISEWIRNCVTPNWVTSE